MPDKRQNVLIEEHITKIVETYQYRKPRGSLFQAIVD
jgi:hypothetical protein